ncbi:MAG: TetR/AcrR family transcriptional regulator [Desertimonas sp.]
MSRRTEILDLARSMFAERGTQATSVRDLAEAAGILPSSLYSHFRSKEALVDEILQQFLDGLLTRFEAIASTNVDPIDRLRSILRSFVSVVDSDPAALSIYRHDFDYLVTLPHISRFYDMHLSIREIWVRAIEEAMDQGRLRRDVDPVVLYRWMRDAIGSSPRWRKDEGHDIGDLSDYAERVFLDGLLVAPEVGSTSAGS